MLNRLMGILNNNSFDMTLENGTIGPYTRTVSALLTIQQQLIHVGCFQWKALCIVRVSLFVDPFRESQRPHRRTFQEVVPMLRITTTPHDDVRSRRLQGFTIIELLVSIAIIAILTALLMPAVQAAREAARKAECKSHLRQLGIAVTLHESTHGWLPTGGWGPHWTGLPVRGYGSDQPGGWIFNVLPYVEQESVRDLGSASASSAPDASANAARLQSAVALFHCPSRRSSIPYENSRQPYYCDPVFAVARNDYAMNGGTRLVRYDPSPETLADAESFGWPDMSAVNGLTHQRSQIRLRDVTDGLTNTIMIGEKHLRRDRYSTGTDLGDNESMYTGDLADLVRFTGPGDDLSFRPLSDAFSTSREGLIFGSSHAGGFHVALCDGSVRFLSYNISLETFSRYGDRADGLAVSP